MADSTLGLLFEISADPSKAQAALEGFRRKTGSDLSSVRSEFELVRKDIAAWRGDSQRDFSTVVDSLSGLREAAGLTFDRFAEGMTLNATLALRYSKSIAEAMAESLKVTTAAIAGESVIQSLRSLGLGFYLLATRDLTGAANAFKAAAIWGSIGGVAGGILGALPGSGLGAASGPATSQTHGRGDSGTGAPTPASAAVTVAPGSAPPLATGNVTVLVMGQPQAAQWLTDVINTGVEQHDLRLVASHTKRGAPAAR